MNILWLQWRDIKHPWSGGAEVYMHEICKRLTYMGVKVHAVTSWFPGLKKNEKLDGYTVERIGSHDNYILYVPRILKKYSGWADIIVEDASKIPLMTPLLRLKNHLPVVAVVHHLNREIYFREITFPKAIIAYIFESIMPWLYTQLPKTVIITVSRSTKQELIKMGANPAKIHVVYNAINATNSSDLQYLKLKKDPRPTLIYLSRIKKYKQPHHALLIFKKVLEQLPDAKLIIAGKGSEILLKFAKKLGIEDAVEIYGEVDEEVKIRLLQKAWVQIQTSEKEGFGLVVLEAAAQGTPTIAYNVPGLRDSIGMLNGGILVRPGDIKAFAQTLINILTNEELRMKFSLNALRYSRKFDWWSSTQKFLKVLIRTLLISDTTNTNKLNNNV